MSREAAIAARLVARYPPDRWALVRHVRSATGARDEEHRVADLVAVALLPSMGAQVEIIEIKDSAKRQGLLRGVGVPREERSVRALRLAAVVCGRSAVAEHCASKSLVPRPWGLLSAGTGKPTVIVEAEEREPAEQLSAFEWALLRAAVANTGESAAGDAPLVEVIRPFLSRGHVGLGCHHVTMSLAKTLPPKLPCWACFEGRPTDPEAIEVAIADESPEQLARYAALCGGSWVA